MVPFSSPARRAAIASMRLPHKKAGDKVYRVPRLRGDQTYSEEAGARLHAQCWVRRRAPRKATTPWSCPAAAPE